MSILGKLENRYIRHSIFWLSWILGFTFVKSFGESLDHYLAWLSYYLLTLPVFMIHTYLIVYWAGTYFLQGARVLLFILIFLISLLLFSYVELWLTEIVLANRWPGIFSQEVNRFSIGNILVSGIGNLYILLVFIAARMIRSWYLADKDKQLIVRKNLVLERADANAGIQPQMLLYAVSGIEKLAMHSKELVPSSLALLSELLNSVMQARQSILVRVDEEVQNVKRMLKLYASLLETPMPRMRIEGDNLSMKMLPAFILFSPLEIICRRNSWLPGGFINVTILSPEQIEIDMEAATPGIESLNPIQIQRELNQLYPDSFDLSMEAGKEKVTIRMTSRS